MAQSASSPVTVSPRPRSLPSRSSTRTAAQSPRRGSAGACAGVPGPGGSSSVSYTFNLSGSAKIVAGISAYVGVDSSTANGIDASGGNSGSSASVTAPSVTTSRAGDMVAAYWATNTNTTLPADASTTQRWTLLSGGGGAKHTGTAGDYTFAGTGGTGTKVSTAGASGAWVADQVALFLDNTPPSAPSPTITEGSNDSYQSGSTFYYRPAGGGGTFTVTEGASDPEPGDRLGGRVRVRGLLRDDGRRRRLRPAARRDLDPARQHGPVLEQRRLRERGPGLPARDRHDDVVVRIRRRELPGRRDLHHHRPGDRQRLERRHRLEQHVHLGHDAAGRAELACRLAGLAGEQQRPEGQRHGGGEFDRQPLHQRHVH